MDSTTDDHNVVHIKFDYINPDRQTRDYIMESQEDSRVKYALPLYLGNLSSDSFVKRKKERFKQSL